MVKLCRASKRLPNVTSKSVQRVVVRGTVRDVAQRCAYVARTPPYKRCNVRPTKQGTAAGTGYSGGEGRPGPEPAQEAGRPLDVVDSTLSRPSIRYYYLVGDLVGRRVEVVNGDEEEVRLHGVHDRRHEDLGRLPEVAHELVLDLA